MVVSTEGRNWPGASAASMNATLSASSLNSKGRVPAEAQDLKPDKEKGPEAGNLQGPIQEQFAPQELDASQPQRKTLVGPLQVACYAEITWVDGGRTIYIDTLDQALRFTAAPEAFAAAYVGMTVAQYRTWLCTDGRLRCTGRTVQGRRCRNMIGFHTEPAEWLARRPTARCHLHGEGTL